MLTNVFTSLGWTRDDIKWTVGILAALIVGLAGVPNTAAADYGIPVAILPYLRLGALIVGLMSAAMKASSLSGQNDANRVNPTNFTKPAAMLVLAVGLSALSAGCAKMAPTLSPPALSAVKATEVVHAFDVVRDVAVTLNQEQPPVISAKSLQLVVSTHRNIVSVIGAAPNGWKPRALAALDQLQKDLPAADAQRLGPYLSLVHALVDAFVPAAVPNAAIPWTVTPRGF